MKIIESFLRKLGYELRKLEPGIPLHRSRFEYQSRFLEFDIPSNSKVLDIGSGSDPFPYATVLAERYLEPNVHRTTKFESQNKPIVLCDVHQLPFSDDEFDYVYCAHVLEHVKDPVKACQELMRVGQAGYIETPMLGKDILFSRTEEMHQWHVVAIGNRLIFFEYDSRHRKGIESSAWRDIVHSKYEHPLRESFHSHLDLFNVMFQWKDGFECVVYYLDGNERRSR